MPEGCLTKLDHTRVINPQSTNSFLNLTLTITNHRRRLILRSIVILKDNGLRHVEEYRPPVGVKDLEEAEDGILVTLDPSRGLPILL